MTQPAEIRFIDIDTDALAAAEGRIAVVVGADGKLDRAGRRVNRLSRGALERFVASERFAKAGVGEAAALAFPAGLAAESVDAVKLGRRPSVAEARKAGAALARAQGEAAMLVLAGATRNAAEIAHGFALARYEFADMKSEAAKRPGEVRFMVTRPEEVAAAAKPLTAVAEGVFFTRDLVNTPSNVLTTDDFTARLAAMGELGIEVEILEEADLERLGMRLLLAVGEGSRAPSRMVVMRWNGGAADAAPLALAGKGVVFDAGGISIKPAAGMEEMTMDMGGAGTVAGVMRALALRGAQANVVGLVGLVENMPDGAAMRPGDVVTSMKGDTVEIINTDAEGRLVLADVLWYAQETYRPAGIVDLATLTGAIIIGLGHEKAGVFANDDAFAERFLRAAGAEEEGAWRMPLGDAYDKALKSQIADFKNVGGRPAGSITAAQFLQRFVREGMPWMHLDIAGVARVSTESAFAPPGATGWGVRALDRLIRDSYEG